MKQQYELGQEVFVFRAQKGELVPAKGIVCVAEIDKSGYILYTVQVQVADQTDSWRANNASMATTAEELNTKMEAYKRFNEEQKVKYVELFGAPEFNAEEMGLK